MTPFRFATGDVEETLAQLLVKLALCSLEPISRCGAGGGAAKPGFDRGIQYDRQIRHPSPHDHAVQIHDQIRLCRIIQPTGRALVGTG